MTVLTSSTGYEWDVTLTVPMLLKAEEEFAPFSLPVVAKEVASRFRITSADRILRMLGSSYEEFLDRGFTYNDCIVLCRALMEDVGFLERSPTTSEEPTPAES